MSSFKELQDEVFLCWDKFDCPSMKAMLDIAFVISAKQRDIEDCNLINSLIYMEHQVDFLIYLAVN